MKITESSWGRLGGEMAESHYLKNEDWQFHNYETVIMFLQILFYVFAPLHLV